MSRVIQKFPPERSRKRVQPRYNWDLWLDGRIHAITPAEYGEVYTFRNAAHAMASRHGLKLRTTVHNGDMILQASSEQERPFRNRSTKRRKVLAA